MMTTLRMVLWCVVVVGAVFLSSRLLLLLVVVDVDRVVVWFLLVVKGEKVYPFLVDKYFSSTVLLLGNVVHMFPRSPLLLPKRIRTETKDKEE